VDSNFTIPYGLERNPGLRNQISFWVFCEWNPGNNNDDGCIGRVAMAAHVGMRMRPVASRGIAAEEGGAELKAGGNL